MSPEYAFSFGEFGSPLYLDNAGAWVLRRPIRDTAHWDAMGLYPVMCCGRWNGLANDLSTMSDLVSLVTVTDTFSGQDAGSLLSLGFDFARPYKEHVVVNMESLSVSKHHDYYARRALRDIDVDVRDPRTDDCLETWHDLYSALVARHSITGIQAFSRESFSWQLRAPGMVVFAGVADGEVVGMHLWYEHDNVAYSHLAASTERGYNLMVAYALHQAAIDYFEGRVEYLDLGAGAGVSKESDGLSWFKNGWSDDRLPVYLCGKVFRRDVYDELTGDVGDGGTFFPAYRRGTT